MANISEAKIKELQAKMASLETSSGSSVKKLTAADSKYVVTLIAKEIGVDRAFEIRGMPANVKANLVSKFKLNSDGTKHAEAIRIAKVLRMSKQIEVKIAEKSVVLINQPQEAHQPSKWAVMSV